VICLAPPAPAAYGREIALQGRADRLLRPRTQIELRVPVLLSPIRKVTLRDARMVQHVKRAGS